MLRNVKGFKNVSEPPVRKIFRLMDAEEAKEFYVWHMANLSARIHNMSVELDFCADYTASSLEDLWSKIIKCFCLSMELDECAQSRFQSLVDCAGLYLAEVFRRNHSQIFWHCNIDTADHDAFKNKPVLLGFFDRSFQPPFPMIFEPIHMVRVQAVRIERGRANGRDLLDLYNKWCTHL